MIKKGFVIGIVIVFLVGSFASGITVNLKDSVKHIEPKKSQYLSSRGSGLVAYWDFDEGTGDVLHDVSVLSFVPPRRIYPVTFAAAALRVNLPARCSLYR